MVKKLVINALMFLALVMAPLYCLDFVVNKGLRNCYYTDGCLNDVYSGRAGADLLFMGSSKIKYQYSPAIFDSALHTTSFNIALNGWPFHMQYTMFRLYLQHNKKPKYIVQGIDAQLIRQRLDFYEYDQYMPYAEDTLIVNATRGIKGEFSFAEKHFPLFLYNNHFDYIKKGVRSYFHIGKPIPSPTYKGYVPVERSWDGSFEQFKNENPNGFDFKVDDTIAKEFYQFLDYCKSNDIKVIFVHTPAYYEETKMVRNQQYLLDYYSKIATQFNIPVLYYLSDSMCFDKRYFVNSQHLNKIGAEKFSRKLAADLQPYVKP